jgi:hypothetical protein
MAGTLPNVNATRFEAVPAGLTYRLWIPQSEVEQNQELEGEWAPLPGELVAYLRSPNAPQLRGDTPLYNGVVGSCFPLTVGPTQSIVALIENSKRAYVIVQNQGPGNLFVQFGSSAAVGLSLKFVPQQVYEPQIAGHFDAKTGKGAIVPIRNSLNLIADAANTLAIVGEATWVAKGIGV